MLDKNVKWLLAANPKSGNGAVNKQLPRILKKFKEMNISYDIMLSTHARELTTLVENAIVNDGYRYIIGIGGDGTMNEIVNGIFKQNKIPTTDIAFTMLPIGTGNDWATAHRIPKDLEQFCYKILRGVSYLQDVGIVHFTDSNGQVKTHYFANAGGLAYDSFVVQSVESQKQYVFGKKLAYFLHVLKCLWQYAPEPVCICIDAEKIEDYFYTINLGIHKTSGGGMIMTPQAVNDDGLMALTVIKNLSKWKVLYHTPKLFMGTIGNVTTYVKMYQAKKIKIESKGNPVMIETDGELLGFSPVEVGILEKALNVIVPSDGRV